MKKLNKILNNLVAFVRELSVQIFRLLVAISLIAGLCYIRFLPRIARDLYENMTYARIGITCCIIIFIIFNIYTTLKSMGIIKTKEPTGILKILKDKIENTVNYIYFTLQNLYEFIWFIPDKIAVKIFKKEDIYFFCVRPIAKYCVSPIRSVLFFKILILIKFLPRIIFLEFFFIEVFFYQHLNYTFTLIPILLISYLENIFLFILDHFCDIYYEGVASFMDFDFDKKPGDIVISFKPGVEDLDEIPYGAKNLRDYFRNHFYVLYAIPFFIHDYKNWKNDVMYSNYTTLVLQIFRLEIYSFILLYGLNLLS